MIQGVLDLFGSLLPSPPTKGPRIVRLGAVDVPYTLTRAKRRTIGMYVGPQGLEVRAPRWVTIHEVIVALQERSDWILRKLQETQQRHAELQQKRIDWRDGCELPFMGQPLRVSIQHRSGKSRITIERDVTTQEATLLHLVADTATLTPSAIGDAVQGWMKHQAREHFKTRLDHFAPMLGVQWHQLAISNATTRWGSAGRTREGVAVIRLNWRLMQHRPDVIDYVVVHELSHLRVMDHSPRFWEAVASVMPHYEPLRRVLRDEPLPPWS